MFEHSNPYTIRTKAIDGISRYFVSFKDGQGILREIEVSKEVFLVFYNFKKNEKKQQNFFDRHIEHFDLTDVQVNRRALYPSKDIAETVLDNIRKETILQAISKLPAIQRRRFILHYELELTYEQIADMEQCSKTAVKYSVDKAKAAIIKKINIFDSGA